MGRMLASILYKDANIESSSGISDEDIKREVRRQMNDEMGNVDSNDIPKDTGK